MATKNNPGKFDCYGAADPDEPLFVLRANDELAPSLVRLWAIIRGGGAYSSDMFSVINEAASQSARKSRIDPDKVVEAYDCADQMQSWKIKNGK